MTMRRFTLALLAVSTLGACASSSGVETSPTYAAARYVPEVKGAPQEALRSNTPKLSPGDRGSGGCAVRGSTCFTEADPTAVHRVRLSLKRAFTILLPEGERFNGAVGGDVEAFLVNISYAGPRPAVSVLARHGRARGNLVLTTTGGLHQFDLGLGASSVTVMDISRPDQSPATRTTTGTAEVQPQGDYTPLSFTPVDGPMPPWAPVEAWADSYKAVIRFPGPLPTMPALFAGMKGEQITNYRAVRDGQDTMLVTSRRVTEMELRLGSDRLRFTVDRDAIASGQAADPAKGADGWKSAEALPSTSVQPAASNVAVVVMPAGSGPASVPAGAFSMPQQFGPVQITGASLPEKPPAKQPMANNIVHQVGL